MTGLSRVGRSAFPALSSLSLTDCAACFCLTGRGRLVWSGPCTPAAPEHLAWGSHLGPHLLSVFEEVSSSSEESICVLSE